MSFRMDKINRQIQKLIAEIVREEMDDPVADFLSITHVDTTPDLQEARVYFSILDDKKIADAQNALDKMSKVIRSILGKRITLRILPVLRFIADDTIHYSVEIYKKVEDVLEDERKRKEAHNTDGGGNAE